MIDLDDFAAHLRAKGRAARTIHGYVADLRHVLAITGAASVDAVKPAALDRYFGRSVGRARLSRVSSAWEAARKWAEREGVTLIKTPFDSPVPRPDAEGLTDAERASIEAFATKHPGHHRAVACVLLMHTGLRSAEVLALTAASLGSRDKRGAPTGTIAIKRKGGKTQDLPINRTAAAAVAVLCPADAPPKRAVLASASGKAWSKSRLFVAVRDVGKACGIDGLHPHQLRHAFADSLRRQGVDIKTICDLMGHASIRTTEIYFRTTSGDLSDAVAKLDPHGKGKRR